MIKELKPSNIAFIIVHCSDSTHGWGVDARTIHNWHIQRKVPFDCIGYHKVILEDGMVEAGRPEYMRGAHCLGYNWCSLSVCLVGRHTFSDAQKDSLKMLLDKWVITYPRANIVGHSDLNSSKTCPNFNVREFLYGG
jgi:N-acetylmuramoyl-L-alanine amidase